MYGVVRKTGSCMKNLYIIAGLIFIHLLLIFNLNAQEADGLEELLGSDDYSESSSGGNLLEGLEDFDLADFDAEDEAVEFEFEKEVVEEVKPFVSSKDFTENERVRRRLNYIERNGHRVSPITHKRAYRKKNNHLTPFQFSEDYQRYLLVAAARGEIDGVRALLDKGMDVNQTDIYGNTLLMLATARGHSQMVKFLIRRGADPKITNDKGENMVHVAIRNNNINAFGPLVKLGVDINGRDSGGNTPFMLALKEGKIDMANKLLHYGANPNVTDNAGLNSLHISTALGYDTLVERMLSLGVDPLVLTPSGSTAKEIALVNDFRRIFEILDYAEHQAFDNIGSVYALKRNGFNGSADIDIKGIATPFQGDIQYETDISTYSGEGALPSRSAWRFDPKNQISMKPTVTLIEVETAEEEENEHWGFGTKNEIKIPNISSSPAPATQINITPNVPSVQPTSSIKAPSFEDFLKSSS